MKKEITNRQKIEEKLDQAERGCNYLERRFPNLVKKVAKINKKGARGPGRKSFDEYSMQHQSRIKKQLKEDCQGTLTFLGLYNFMATKVEVFNTDTEQYDTFNLIDEEQLPPEAEGNELSDSQVDDINYWIYVKDKFSISNEAWHELAIKCKSIPNKSKWAGWMAGWAASQSQPPPPPPPACCRYPFLHVGEQRLVYIFNTFLLSRTSQASLKLDVRILQSLVVMECHHRSAW